MEIDPVVPSQRQEDSGDDKVAVAVEALAIQVAAVEELVAMMAGPSQKKRRVLMELFPSGGVAPQAPPSHPNPMPSSSSHGLNDAASAVARQAAVAGGPIA